MTPVSHSVAVHDVEGVSVESDELNAVNVAKGFVEARRAGRAVAGYPGTPPADLDEAYRIQDAAIALTRQTIAGWKVGKIAPALAGVNRLTGPIFADQVVAAGAKPAAMPVFAEGFAAAEAEYLLRLRAAPTPGKADWSIEEARALVDAVHVGIEIASSPYAGINADGPAVTVSDFGNNNGLVVGDPIVEWRDVDLDTWPVTLLIDGVEAGAATTATMLDGPFGAVRFLLEHAARRGLPLAAGDWVSTGAVTGVHPVVPGDRIEARFGSAHSIHCTVKAR